jgi:ribosomal protein L29
MKKEHDDGTAMGWTASELRQLSNSELLGRLAATREAILGLNTKAAQALYGRKRHAQQPHYYKGYRRAVARILTVMNEARMR